jgi:hypothetical protein
MPMNVKELLALIEADGWVQAGSVAAIASFIIRRRPELSLCRAKAASMFPSAR